MNLFNIINEIEKVDPEFSDRISPRRAAIRNMTGFGQKIAMAALPLAMGSLFKKAYGQSQSSTAVVAVLNYALTLEYLESTFYDMGAAASGLVPATDTAYVNSIKTDEDLHVTFLQTAITGAGGTPVAKSSFTFDFTAGGTAAGPTNAGPFADVFTNYKTFLAVAETFEDTGVRAYKGQAGALLLNPVLTAALDIHAVEARHASAVRYLRNKYGYDNINPWITGTAASANDTNIGSAVDANYAGESTTTQLNISILGLPSLQSSTSTSLAIASAAFDEPLDMNTVLGILVPAFIQEAQ